MEINVVSETAVTVFTIEFLSFILEKTPVLITVFGPRKCLLLIINNFNYWTAKQFAINLECSCVVSGLSGGVDKNFISLIFPS